MTRTPLLVVVLAAALRVAHAIVIRDDVDDALYRGDPAEWPAVFSIDPSGRMRDGECAATLITAQHALTAAHCVIPGGSYGSYSYSYSYADDDGDARRLEEGASERAFDVAIAGDTYTVVAAYPNPCFDMRRDGPNGHDVAVIKLDRPVPGVAPYPIYLEGDEAGRATTLVGWGDTGTASECCEMDRTFRVAQNRVERVGDGLLYQIFDREFPREGLSWLGDSGGPLFVDGDDGATYLAGVNSDGDCCDYGVHDEYKRAGDHFAWVRDVVAADLGAAAPLAGTSKAAPSYAGACLWSADDDDDDDDDDPADWRDAVAEPWVGAIVAVVGLVGVVGAAAYCARRHMRTPKAAPPSAPPGDALAKAGSAVALE